MSRLTPQLCLLFCLLLAVGACLGPEQAAAQLKSAATADQLPKVVACWEASFEAADFRGEYVAVVDFEVHGGKIEEASVSELVDTSDGNGSFDIGAFRSCIEDALNASRLKVDGSMVVTSYRFAFGDASRKARQNASDNTANLLLGPRADRCQGLYGHDPPRESAQLHNLLEQAQGEASRQQGTDQDRFARALQQSYDIALELAERLQLDLNREDLPEGSRDRMREARDQALRRAESIGQQIGCQR